MLLVRYAFVLFFLAYTSAAFAASSEVTSPDALAKQHAALGEHGPHLEGSVVTLPLVMVKGFPFIEGSINGQPGKLMFDLGLDQSLAIDSHAVDVSGKIKVGTGHFGSGETFERFTYPLVRELTLPGGLHDTNMTDVLGNPGLPIEQGITADFIGWLGVDFFSGYVLKIDYSRPSVTFYRDDAGDSGRKAALAGEHVVRSIHIAPSQGHKSLMHLRVNVGRMTFMATLDTGSHTVINVNDGQLAALKKRGSLRQTSDNEGTITGLVVDGIALAPMHVEIAHGMPPEKNFLPPTDGPFMTIGFEFLSRYKTVWNYDAQTLILLKK